MPTYTVTNSNFTLTSKQQNNLAEGITKVHNVVTGANTYFAQVIFNKTKKNNHFMGGKKVKEPSIFLLGQIRAGRPKKTKDKLISYLRKNPKIQIEIQGHTDDVGSEIDNLILSKKRARAVYDYIMPRVDNKLRHIGYGESRPLSSNNSDNGRELNRRTSFVIQ